MGEELNDGIVLEFRWTVDGVDTKAFYMVYVNQKLTKEDIDGIKDGIAAYLEVIGDDDPKQLIHDVLGAAGFSHRIVGFYSFAI